MAGRVRTGIAGWVFDEWRGGAFYPAGLKQKEELGFASRALTSIEINGTFYSNQRPASFQNWASQTPGDFVFSIKGHQYVTHIKKLNDVEVPLANFFASGPLALGARLGPFCWQLPGNLSFNAERIESFLALLPQDPDATVRLAAKHDERLKDPAFTDTSGVTRIRHAIEVRHKSFADPAFIALLRKYNVALVIADTADWPFLDQTADFSYARLQGAPGADHYEAAEIDAWAQRVASWSEGTPLAGGSFVTPPAATAKPRDVFAYFVSTDKVHAPANALALAAKLGVVPDR